MSTTELNPVQHQQGGSEPDSPADARHSRWLSVAAIAAAVLLGTVIYSGIHARALAQRRLGITTEQAAITTVNVVHPKQRSGHDEIVLPGYTQAFSDTPIYARTNGYLNRWYFDIGAQV